MAINYLRRILPIAYTPLRVGNIILQGLGLGKPRLRVLMYHDVPPSEMERFRLSILWIKKSWNFLTPNEFESVLRGTKEIFQDSVLCTFDDGFLSNRAVVEQILNPLGIKAIFFVIPNFLDQTTPTNAKEFAADRLKLNLLDKNVSMHIENLRWEDLHYLVSSGHAIGAHSLTHERLLDKVGPGVLEREILQSGQILAERLDVNIRHFAFPFGNFSSIGMQATKVALSRYEFVHTGIRGNNRCRPPTRLIRRDALQAGDDQALIGAFLQGGADLLYRRQNNQLSKWERNIG